MTKDLTKDPNVILRRGGAGTNSYGLYVDFVVYAKSTGAMVRQERYFIAGAQLCKYMRPKGNKRAAWRSFPLPNHEEARTVLIRNLARYKDSSVYGIEMVHVPMLIELTSVDIDALKKNEAPAARHEGSRATEKAVGKLDDEKKYSIAPVSEVPF